MHLTPREQEKLLLFTAGEVARRRRDRGLKLNHPEAIALISAELLEGARDGKSVSELMSFGASLLTENDVMQGVAEMIDTVQVEATFPDGTKLVTVHHPIRPLANEADQNASAPQEGAYPGEVIICDEPIVINEGRKTRTITVTNTGDRPVQVGSHYHFAQVNPALEFEREQAEGFRLDIPAGTSARFEPRDAKEIRLVEYGGNRNIHGFRQGAPDA